MNKILILVILGLTATADAARANSAADLAKMTCDKLAVEIETLKDVYLNSSKKAREATGPSKTMLAGMADTALKHSESARAEFKKRCPAPAQ